MKKIYIGLVLLVFGSQVAAVNASETSLEDQLEALTLPSNQSPVSVSQESLYAIQTRYVPLKKKSELSVGLARNFTGNGLVNSNQFNLGYRFHLSNDWSISANGSYVFNSLSASGQVLLSNFKVLPDTPYVKYRTDLMANYNVFYGKFRLSMDQVLYFDQYVSLGAGNMFLNYGNELAAVADVGFVFWIGKSGTIRIGVKDYLYSETRIQDRATANHVLAHLDIGFLLGGEN